MHATGTGRQTVEEQQPLAGFDIDVPGLVDTDCACCSLPHGGPQWAEAGGGRPQIRCKTPIHGCDAVWCGGSVVVVRAADG